jgi:hypothetical protein
MIIQLRHTCRMDSRGLHATILDFQIFGVFRTRIAKVLVSGLKVAHLVPITVPFDLEFRCF